MQMKYNNSISNVFIFPFEMKFHEIRCARIFHRFVITIFEIKANGLLAFSLSLCSNGMRKKERIKMRTGSFVYIFGPNQIGNY